LTKFFKITYGVKGLKTHRAVFGVYFSEKKGGKKNEKVIFAGNIGVTNKWMCC
jgi:hypothetical protein